MTDDTTPEFELLGAPVRRAYSFFDDHILAAELASLPPGGKSTARKRAIAQALEQEAPLVTGDFDRSYKLANTIAVLDKAIREDESFNNILRAIKREEDADNNDVQDFTESDREQAITAFAKAMAALSEQP